MQDVSVELFEASQRIWRKNAQTARQARASCEAVWIPNLDDRNTLFQDLVARVERLFAHDAGASQPNAKKGLRYENKVFMPSLMPREYGIAPSWGDGKWDCSSPCKARGRQQKWYKGLSHSQWPRLWHWWLSRAATTENRRGSRLTRQLLRRTRTIASSIERSCCGRASRFVRTTPSQEWGR